MKSCANLIGLILVSTETCFIPELRRLQWSQVGRVHVGNANAVLCTTATTTITTAITTRTIVITTITTSTTVTPRKQ